MCFIPRVSVCIPAYNQAKFIHSAITSVLNQSLADDFELIVVDDCSQDATVAVIRSFSDSRLRLVQNQKNLGMVGNWNRCIELANAPIVCLLHGDDLYKPDFLSTVVLTMEQNPQLGFTFCAWNWLDESSGKIIKIQPFSENTIFDSPFAFTKFLCGNLTIPAAVAVRQTAYEKLGKYHKTLRYGPDWEMWLRISANYAVAYHAQPLVTYRTHSESMTSSLRQHPGTLAIEEIKVLRSIYSLTTEKLGLYRGFQSIFNAHRRVADRQFYRSFWYARYSKWRRFRAELRFAFYLDPTIVFRTSFLRAWLRSYANLSQSMNVEELQRYGVHETPQGL